MSEVHNALFCRCCREYLPIHEQEEHRRFHAEPPYMGQKIRIENGQPIIIDRKERASLTPIGMFIRFPLRLDNNFKHSTERSVLITDQTYMFIFFQSDTKILQ